VLNCTTRDYGWLYARWLANPADLLIRGQFKPGERVLDLCGGTGVVAQEALRRGAGRAVLLDLAPRCPDDRVLQVRGPAEQANRLVPLVFDLIVCRQAIGYLDLHRTATAMYHLLGSGGRFIFNNFVRPRWRLKTYRHSGRSYLEASGFVGRHVFHLQSAFLGMDVTHFRWHTDQDIRDAFYGYKIETWWKVAVPSTANVVAPGDPERTIVYQMSREV
jgi:SAM-dependent methyltransferase